jgi:hypothetical protein
MGLLYILGNKEQIRKHETSATGLEIRTFTDLDKLEMTINEPNAIIANSPYSVHTLGEKTGRLYRWSALEQRWRTGDEKEFREPYKGWLFFFEEFLEKPVQTPAKRIYRFPDVLSVENNAKVFELIKKLTNK